MERVTALPLAQFGQQITTSPLLHAVHVFVHARTKDGDPRPVTKINNTACKAARERAADDWQERHGEAAPEGFRRVRVHDLKHYSERGTMPSSA